MLVCSFARLLILIYSFTHTHLLIYSLTHTHTHLLIYSFTRLLIYSYSFTHLLIYSTSYSYSYSYSSYSYSDSPFPYPLSPVRMCPLFPNPRSPRADVLYVRPHTAIGRCYTAVMLNTMSISRPYNYTIVLRIVHKM